jgi:WD40 repeat protein
LFSPKVDDIKRNQWIVSPESAPTRQIVAIGTTTGVYCYDLNTWEEIIFLEIGEVREIAFSYGEKELLVNGGIWDTTSWVLISTYSNMSVFSVSPVENLVAYYYPSQLGFSSVEDGKLMPPEVLIDVHQPTNIVFSFDGTLIAAHDENNTLSVWQVSTGNNVLVLNKFSRTIDAIHFLSNQAIIVFSKGKYGATGENAEVSVWDIASGDLLGIYSEDQLFVTASSSGYQFILDSEDETYTPVDGEEDSYTTTSERNTAIVTLANGELVKTALNDLEGVCNAAFSPDGSEIAVAANESIVIIDADDTNPISILEDDPVTNYKYISCPRDMFFSPDEKYLVGYDDQKQDLLVWDTATGHIVKKIVGFLGMYPSVLISDDSKKINLYSFSGHISHTYTHVIDMETGIAEQYLHEGQWQVKEGSTDDTKEILDSLVIENDNLVNKDTGEVYYHFSGTWITSSLIAPSGKYIILTERGGAIRVLGVGEPSSDDDTILLKPNDSKIRHFVLSLNGARLAAIDDDNFVHIWDTNRSDLIQTISVPVSEDFPMYRDIAISQDGQFVAVARDIETSFVWDITSGELVFIMPESASSIVFISDGKYLVTGSNTNELSFWDTEEWVKVNQLSLGKENVGEIYFLKEDVTREWLWVLQGSPKRLIVFQIEDDQISPFYDRVIESRVGFFADISQTGSYAFMEFDTNPSKDEMCSILRIWDIKTNSEMKSYVIDPSVNLSISPNGNWFVVHSDEGANLWSTADDKIVQTLIDVRECLLSDTYMACLDSEWIKIIRLND